MQNNVPYSWNSRSEFPLPTGCSVNSSNPSDPITRQYHKLALQITCQLGDPCYTQFLKGEFGISPIPTSSDSIRVSSLTKTSTYKIHQKSSLLFNIQKTHFKGATSSLCQIPIICPCGCSNSKSCHDCQKVFEAGQMKSQDGVLKCNSCRSATVRRRKIEKDAAISSPLIPPSPSRHIHQKLSTEYKRGINLMVEGISKRSLHRMYTISTLPAESFPDDIVIRTFYLKNTQKLSPRSLLRYACHYSTVFICQIIISICLASKKFVIASDQFQSKFSKKKHLGVFFGGTSNGKNILSPFFSFSVSGETAADRVDGILTRVLTFCTVIHRYLPTVHCASIKRRVLDTLHRLHPHTMSSDTSLQEILFISFLAHIVGWTADSASSEQLAADFFSNTRQFWTSKHLINPLRPVFHLPDCSHILRNCIQHSVASLATISFSFPPCVSSQSSQFPDDLVYSSSKFPKIAARSLFNINSYDTSDLTLFEERKTFSLFTILSNQILRLPAHLRWPEDIVKAPVSQQMNFDQNLLIFRIVITHISYYISTCKKLLSSSSAKLILQFLENESFIKACQIELLPLLQYIPLFLSSSMAKDAITVVQALGQLRTLFNICCDSDIPQLTSKCAHFDSILQSIPSSSRANTLKHSRYQLRLIFDLQRNFISVYDAYCFTFKYCLGLSISKYILTLEKLLQKSPESANLICSSVDLERYFGLYKESENKLEEGATITTKMLGGYIRYENDFPFDFGLNTSILRFHHVKFDILNGNLSPTELTDTNSTTNDFS